MQEELFQKVRLEDQKLRGSEVKVKSRLFVLD
jgi:hypothetical protein